MHREQWKCIFTDNQTWKCKLVDAGGLLSGHNLIIQPRLSKRRDMTQCCWFGFSQQLFTVQDAVWKCEVVIVLLYDLHFALKLTIYGEAVKMFSFLKYCIISAKYCTYRCITLSNCMLYFHVYISAVITPSTPLG